MTDLRALIYIEIDIKFCELEYGVEPCTAAIGVTGDQPCFNTRNNSADCQDPANFTAGSKTLRFGLNDRPLPANIDCIPLLTSASVTNARVMPGESIGERATLTASFTNSRHGDAGIDPYIIARDYNPFNQGTFWGKFRARNTYLEARPIRIYRGYVGQSLDEMDCEHFVIEKMQGPDASGNVTISGVDFMRLLNSEKAQAPLPNNGYLSLPISTTDTAVTLLPTGIGDAEYPASGKAAIGKELVEFTRTGDDFTLTREIRPGFDAEEHDEGEVLQLVLEYTSETAAAIVNDLVVNYSPLDSSYVDWDEWQEITDSFISVLYSRIVPKPTPVVDLLNELIEQAGLVIFGDTRSQQIVFDVLRPNVPTGLPIGPDEILRDSFRQIDQPKKRFSSVWVFYGKRNIFESDEPTNFYSAVIQPVEDNQYETPSIKKIFSKWIRSEARAVAVNVAARAIARYKFPPLKLQFALFAQNTRRLGQVVTLTDPSLETATGAQAEIDAIVTGWTSTTEQNSFEAEEYNIDATAFDGPREGRIDYDTYNINLRELYDRDYTEVDLENDIIFTIAAGRVVGSTSTARYAIESGDWPAGVEPVLIIQPGAYVVGRGGKGGYGGGATGAGEQGGPAIRVTSPIRIDNSGTIAGAGGGGGGSTTVIGGGSNSGAGGAGRYAGTGASLTEGGQGEPTVGNGGDLGQSGGSGTASDRIHAPGGAAGTAVEGDSLITYINVGTILGARIG